MVELSEPLIVLTAFAALTALWHYRVRLGLAFLPTLAGSVGVVWLGLFAWNLALGFPPLDGALSALALAASISGVSLLLARVTRWYIGNADRFWGR